MKLLVSKIKECETEIKQPQKNIKLFIALLLCGIAVGYTGIALGGIIGIVLLLCGVACIIAGVRQLIGVSECVCPNCNELGYIYKYAKEYKCKSCNVISYVIEK